MLSEKQVAEFHEEGYLVVDDVLDDGQIHALIDEIADEIDRCATSLVGAGLLSRSYSDEPFERRLASITRETDSVLNTIKAGRLSGPALFNMITAPQVLDVIESLCGSELVASSVYRLRPKLPGHSGSNIPWHQDSGYFEPACDDSLIVTVWIPLLDATEERGCLSLMPRTHHHGVYRHSPHPGQVFLEIRQTDLPPVSPIRVPVRKRSILLMTNTTPHTSLPNGSDVIRWSIDARYQSADLPTNAPNVLRSAAVAPDAPPACYPPEADFIVRSRLRPQSVCRDAAAFQTLRQSHQPQPVLDRWNLNEHGAGWRGYSGTYVTTTKTS